MKITFENYNIRYGIETESEAYTGEELKTLFSRLLVVAGFPPGVIEAEEGGKYTYVGDNELIISREEYKKLKGGEDVH
jgi:hypothetical protein